MWHAPYLLRWIRGDSHWSFPSLRREPHPQTRRPLLITGRLRQVCFQAARIAAFIPSSAPEGSGSSSRSFKAINKGHVTTAQTDPDAEWTAPIHLSERLHQTKEHQKMDGGKNTSPAWTLHPLWLAAKIRWGLKRQSDTTSTSISGLPPYPMDCESYFLHPFFDSA